jgi:hypothetical protein
MLLHVRFPAPGFFLNDPRLVVTLDDRTLYDGSFRDGFDVSAEVEPGRRVLETAIHLTGLARRQRFELALGERGYRDIPAIDAKLSYSRLSGNFEKRISLSARR